MKQADLRMGMRVYASARSDWQEIANSGTEVEILQVTPRHWYRTAEGTWQDNGRKAFLTTYGVLVQRVADGVFDVETLARLRGPWAECAAENAERVAIKVATERATREMYRAQQDATQMAVNAMYYRGATPRQVRAHTDAPGFVVIQAALLVELMDAAPSWRADD